MVRSHSAQELDIAELERLLDLSRRRVYRGRRARLRAMGRAIEVPGMPPPDESVATRLTVSGQTGHVPTPATGCDPQIHAKERRPSWHQFAARGLLLIELVVIVLFLFTLFSLWSTNNRLNLVLAQAQRAEGAALALPTPQPTAVIDVAVLPGGHRYPRAGETPQPGEAGYIPAHLLPAINDYESPPLPTPGPEHARRIQVAAIGVESAIYQGMYDWDVLKKGVAQHIGSAAPGQVGNMILAGHNDVYGEVFRDLDRLAPGDEIVVSSERQAYVYVVRETVIVEPTDVSVMAPTDFASLTLISCYPYRVNTKRIVVFADLAG